MKPSHRVLLLTAGLLVLAEVLLQLLAFNGLAAVFEFPDVLRLTAAEVIPRFLAQESTIVTCYYLFLWSSLLYIPLSYWLAHALDQGQGGPSLANQLLIGTGIGTAILQVIGFVRWVFWMPYLAHQWQDSQATRPMTESLYELMNRYAGQSIGEHLGFILMASWTVVLGYLLSRQTTKWGRTLGFVGILLGLMIMVSTAENFGGANAHIFGLINLLANIGWSVWAVALGIYLILQARHPAPSPAV
jgi:hypothetical protein